MNSITIYSTPTCPYCVYAKDYFTQRGVAFTDVDVSRNRAKAMEMVQKSGQMGVPVVDINGTIIMGFDPQAFDAALAHSS